MCNICYVDLTFYG